MIFSMTARGFARVDFTDRNGVTCSLQQSSLAAEDAIWLGCNEPDPRRLVPGQGWQPVTLPEGTQCNTRMHLTRDHVAQLVTALQAWLNATGDEPPRMCYQCEEYITGEVYEDEGRIYYCKACWCGDVKGGGMTTGVVITRATKPSPSGKRFILFDIIADDSGVIQHYRWEQKKGYAVLYMSTEVADLGWLPIASGGNGEDVTAQLAKVLQGACNVDEFFGLAERWIQNRDREIEEVTAHK